MKSEPILALSAHAMPGVRWLNFGFGPGATATRLRRSDARLRRVIGALQLFLRGS